LQRAALRVLALRRPARFEVKQYEGLVAAATVADLRKLSASARAWRRAATAHETLTDIEYPVLVVGSESDSFHAASAARAIAEAIRGAELRMVGNFSALHAPTAGELVLTLLQPLQCDPVPGQARSPTP
jgi:homoserine acetyltransferase